VSVLVAGLSGGLVFAYRILMRPNGVLGPWGQWASWLLGRREL
jgi:hypothetical protein